MLEGRCCCRSLFSVCFLKEKDGIRDGTVTGVQTCALPVPFEVGEGETVQDLMNRIRAQEPPSPRKHNRKISGRLEAIVLKAIEKSPSGRYQSAEELLNDLIRYTKDEPVRARKPSITEYFERSFKRHLGIGLSVTGSIILVLVISLWWKHQV